MSFVPLQWIPCKIWALSTICALVQQINKLGTLIGYRMNPWKSSYKRLTNIICVTYNLELVALKFLYLVIEFYFPDCELKMIWSKFTERVQIQSQSTWLLPHGIALLCSLCVFVCATVLSLAWFIVSLLSVYLFVFSMMEMNKMHCGDAFPTLCEHHGLADVCDSEKCCSCVIGQAFSGSPHCRSWWIYQQAFHCRNMMNENGFVLNFVTKRIILGVDMLQLLEHCGILDGWSQFDSAAVLIKDLTMKMQRCCLQSTSSLPFHFLNQFHKSKKKHYLYHHDTRLVASLLIEKAQKRKMGEWKQLSARMRNNNNTSLYTIHFIQLYISALLPVYYVGINVLMYNRCNLS